MTLALTVTLLIAQGAVVPAGLVPLESEEGRAMLLEAQANRAFLGLAAHFVTQQSQSFCAVASAVVALNAVGAPPPAGGPWAPYREWTQENVFTPAASAIKTAAQVANGGMTLSELSRFLATQPVQSRAIQASSSSLSEFRQLAAQALTQPHHAVLINFLRSSLGQEPNGVIEREVAGHWSPLGAYDEKADRFLLLDVARYKYPPVWARAADLFAAMQTTDLASGAPRGFILLQPGQGAVGQPVRGRTLVLPIVAGLALFFLLLGGVIGFRLGRRKSG